MASRYRQNRPKPESSARGESAAHFGPGNSLHRSAIELGDAPVHFGRPCGLGVLAKTCCASSAVSAVLNSKECNSHCDNELNDGGFSISGQKHGSYAISLSQYAELPFGCFC